MDQCFGAESGTAQYNSVGRATLT